MKLYKRQHNYFIGGDVPSLSRDRAAPTAFSLMHGVECLQYLCPVV